MKIYDFSVKNRKGEDISLENYKGKVLLIVNTATRCGFTPQYDELEALYSKYNKEGFEVLDFPCNQFGNQAPESDEEIHTFCQLNYKVKFDQFAKVEVNGENAILLFKYLKEQKGFAGFDPKHKLTSVLTEMLSKNDPDFAKKSDIKWNFTKFLVDREGNVIARFEPTTNGADAIAQRGAKEVYACCSHAVFSDPAIERLEKSALKEVIVTDSIALPERKKIDKIKILSVDSVFAAAMDRIINNKSVSELFE